MNNEKIIALDIGGVCVQLRYDLCFNYFGFDAGMKIPDELMYAIDQMERGKISESEWLKIFQQVTGGRYTDDQLRYGYNLIIGEEIPGMPELVKEITDSGCRFVFFSDSSEIHIMHTYRKLPFANLISGGIFSYDAKAKKPEPGMYEAFEAQYGKPFFYLDDKPENVAAAAERGWASHQFTAAEDFRKEISKLF